MEQFDVTMLESTHMVSIILYVSTHPGSRKTEIYRDVGRNMGMPAKLEMLEAAGLLASEDLGQGRKSYTLTDQGMMVAGMLRDIDPIVGGDGAFPWEKSEQ